MKRLLTLLFTLPLLLSAVELLTEGAVTVEAGKSKPFRLPLDPAWKYLKIETAFQCRGVTTGAESWQDGRLALRFLNAENRGVGPLPRVFHATGDQAASGVRYHEIPEGARSLLAEAANFGSSGTVTFTQLNISGVTAADLKHPADLPPPDGSTPAELDSLDDAFRETTPTRERISLNGLWRFRPVGGAPETVVPPEGSGWGHFKVPGVWPDRGDSEGPNDAQELHLPLATLLEFQNQKIDCAWYRRKLAIPAAWRGRKIRLFFELLQGSALIHLDGKRIGELHFPGGAFELPDARPGSTHDLAILVSARTGKAAAVNFTAPERMTVESAALANRGITGDLWLESLPAAGHLEGVGVTTSVAAKTITVTPESTTPGSVAVTIRRGDKTVLEFQGERSAWPDPALWSPQHPENLYTAEVRLLGPDGNLLDQFYPVEFGFREFSIAGRDFLLNGSPFPLRALVACHMLGKADRAGAEIARALCCQAKKLNANFLLPENYDFAPGRVTYLKNFYVETARAGILSAFTLPHAKEFGWKLDDPAKMARYRQLAQFLIRQVRNNPGVVLYAMNHNATGYFADQNPLKTGPDYNPDTLLQKHDPELFRRRRQAELAPQCASELDPTRPAYHHQSGKLGVVQTLNCYLNWLPPRERADYFKPWSESGELPLFLVEYGLPHVASYSSYRGPGFIWGAWALQTNDLDEYNAEYLGRAAFRPEPVKQKQLAREEKLLAAGKPITYAWIRPPAELPDNQRVLTEHIDTVLTQFRMLGVSGVLPWDQYLFWRHLGKPELRETNPARYENLKRPGIVPDFFNPVLNDGLYTRKTDAFELSVAGRALQRAWEPRLIRFGERGWNLRPGETVDVPVELRNDSGTDETWRVTLNGETRTIPAPNGETVRLTFPAAAAPEWKLTAETPAGTLPAFRRPRLVEPPAAVASPVEIFDPEGTLAPELLRLKIPFRAVERFSGESPAVIGRNALHRLGAPLPENVNCLILEQSAATLESLGFRVAERGFRRIFDTRTGEALECWRGDATLTAPWLETPPFEKFYPMHFRQGFYQRRSWRGGNAGNIASVVFEKPERGDFQFRFECGFNLQYTPLAELRDNNGRKIIFCQLDVSGRTEPDPLAERILAGVIAEIGQPPKARQFRPVRFDPAEPGLRELLEALRIPAEPATAPVAPDTLLVTGGSSRFPIPENGAVFRFGVADLPAQPFDALPPEWITGLYARTRFHRLAVSADRQEVRLSATPRELLDNGFFTRTARRANRRLVNRLLIELGARPPVFTPVPGDGGTAWGIALDEGWLGAADPENRGRNAGFERFGRREAEQAKWRPVTVPGCFDRQFPELRDYDGLFWYQLEFELPAEPVPGEKYKLHFGAIDDESHLWLNGEFLGEVTQATHPGNYYVAPREYSVDGKLLKPTGNRLIVLVNDLRGNGGILGTPYLSVSPPSRFYCENAAEEDNPYRYYRW